MLKGVCKGGIFGSVVGCRCCPDACQILQRTVFFEQYITTSFQTYEILSEYVIPLNGRTTYELRSEVMLNLDHVSP